MAESNEATAQNTVAREEEDSTIKEMRTELSTFKDDITDDTKFFKGVVQEMVHNIETAKANRPVEDSMSVGSEAIQPLIKLKTAATEIVSNVRSIETEKFQEEIDFEPFEKHITGIKRMNSDVKEGTKCMRSALKGIAELHKLRKEKKNVDYGECSTAAIADASVASDVPSISEFNLFDNSNVATSSPLPNPKNQDKQED